MAARSRIALALVVAVVAATLIVLAAARGQEPGGWTPEPGRALTQPRELKSPGKVLRARIPITQGRVQVGGDALDEVMTYDGDFVGPTLRVKPGDTLRLTFVNELPVATNVHFHGLHVSPRAAHGDNVLIHIPPGRSHEYVIELPPDHDPGTFWYHSHHHGDTEAQLSHGLSGVLIVEGLRERLPRRGEGVTERILALKDMQVAKDSRVPPATPNVQAPTTRLVNGDLVPKLAAGPVDRNELWHLANIGTNIFYELDLSGLDARVVAEDGNPVKGRLRRARTLVMPPGKRYAVVVQGEERSVELNTLAYPDQGHQALPAAPLATIEFAPESGRPMDLPRRLRPGPEPRTTGLRRARGKHLVFSQEFDAATSTFRAFVNDRQFQLGRIDFRSRLGTSEIWTIDNVTSEQHPFHLHQYDFRVLSINGRRYRARNDQDTVLLPAGTKAMPGRVVIRVPFTDYAGDLVFHCHILGHEDAGMMASLRVRR